MITPPFSSSISSRAVVVCRPRQSSSLISLTFCLSLPSRAFMSVDFPTPDEPSNTTVLPSWRYSDRGRMPMPSVALIAYIGTSCAIAFTSFILASTFPHISDLFNNITGSTRFCLTTERYLSNRLIFRSRLREVIIKATSILVTIICSPVAFPASFREILLFLGRIACIV